MKLRIVIEMANAAFGDTPSERGEEVARIVRRAADRFADRGLVVGDSGGLMDTNGNRVGGWKVAR